MPAVWQASGAVAGKAAAFDVTPTIPAHQADDLLIMWTASRSTSDSLFSAISGWTALASAISGGSVWRVLWFYRVATNGSTTNPLCDWNQNGDHYAQVFTIRGADPSDPFDVSGQRGGTTVDPAVFTGVTTTGANKRVFVFFTAADDSSTAATVTGTNPASFTQHSYGVTTVGADAGGGVFSAVRTTAGATGNVSVNYNAVSPHASAAAIFAVNDAATNQNLDAGSVAVAVAAGGGILSPGEATIDGGSIALDVEVGGGEVTPAPSLIDGGGAMLSLLVGGGDLIPLPTTLDVGGVELDVEVGGGEISSVTVLDVGSVSVDVEVGGGDLLPQEMTLDAGSAAVQVLVGAGRLVEFTPPMPPQRMLRGVGQ